MAEPQSDPLAGRPLPAAVEADRPTKLLPFDTEPTGYAWLHSRCWDARKKGRKAEALAALSTFGIFVRTSL